MVKQRLELFAKDEGLMENFIEHLENEIISDDEMPRKKFSALKEAYEKDPALVDDVLMAICGWRMESLVENTPGLI